MKTYIFFILFWTASTFVYSQETQGVVVANLNSISNVESILGVMFVNATQIELDEYNKLHKSSLVNGLKVISRKEKARKISGEVTEGDILIEYYTIEGLNAKRFVVKNKKEFFKALLEYKQNNKKEVRITTQFGKPGFHTLFIFLSKITIEQIQEDIAKMND